jgi:hypothetical protein
MPDTLEYKDARRPTSGLENLAIHNSIFTLM